MADFEIKMKHGRLGSLFARVWGSQLASSPHLQVERSLGREKYYLLLRRILDLILMGELVGVALLAMI